MCVICFSFAVSGHALADMCGKKAFYHCQCCGRCCCCRTPNTLNSFAHTFRGRFVCSAAALFFFSKNNFYHLNLFLWWFSNDHDNICATMRWLLELVVWIFQILFFRLLLLRHWSHRNIKYSFACVSCVRFGNSCWRFQSHQKKSSKNNKLTKGITNLKEKNGHLVCGGDFVLSLELDNCFYP